VETRDHKKNGAIPKSQTRRKKSNELKMKKLAFITGVLSFSLTSLGILFKIVHWPGANYLLVIGLGLFSIIFIPSIAKYLYDKEK
jgi:hypothetical protein